MSIHFGHNENGSSASSEFKKSRFPPSYGVLGSVFRPCPNFAATRARLGRRSESADASTFEAPRVT
jgi:hypothetical protein